MKGMRYLMIDRGLNIEEFCSDAHTTIKAIMSNLSLFLNFIMKIRVQKFEFERNGGVKLF